MKQYTITCVSGQPDWSCVPALAVDHFNWTEKVDIQMRAQICYNEDGLYLHLQACEKEIRAEYTGPLADVYEDSCMEFFFCPEADDPRYFNFEMNPNGSMFIGFGYDDPRPVRLVLPEEDTFLQKKMQRTADGWEAFFTVPIALISSFYPGYRLESGKKIRANCYKCGDKTVEPHYISWNPMTHPTPRFHKPEDFGEMTLA